ncbi:MAG: hypothetical protein H6Q21_2334, partial [Bacteroidetes bacterium]|nr:hypothetical protein [Bacteroidota bacterium]
MMKKLSFFLIPLWLITACQQSEKTTSMFITTTIQQKAIDQLIAAHGENLRSRIETGVGQAAFFWKQEDGTTEEFVRFCSDNFAAGEGQR